jgi:tellurite resistance protein
MRNDNPVFVLLAGKRSNSVNTRKLMQLTVAVAAMLAAYSQAQAQDEVEEIRLPNLQSEKEFADRMPVTGTRSRQNR